MSNETPTKNPPQVRPACDVLEREDGYHIFLDLPGMKKNDLVLDLKENRLIIRGLVEYNWGAEEKNLELEFGSGEYLRTFTIADVVDRERIRAVLDNGVLEIHLPRIEKTFPKRIEVSRG